MNTPSEDIVFSHERVGDASAEKLSEVSALWRSAFGDSEDFTSFMLKSALHDAELFSAHKCGVLCSMFFLLRIDIEHKPKSAVYPSYYLYAAATDEKKRGRHIFTRLLYYSEDFLRKKSAEFLFLRPARYELCGFYEKLGFYVVTFCRDIKIKPENKGYNFHRCSYSDEIYDLYLLGAGDGGYFAKKDERTFKTSVECAMFDGAAELFECDAGFALADTSGDEVRIIELFVNSSDKESVAADLLHYINKEGSLVGYGAQGDPYAMAKQIKNNEISELRCSLLFE